MRTFRYTLQSLGLLGAALFLAGCNSGGNLSLEPGARKVTSLGSPYVRLNEGGKALVVESGQTATTGVHGWVTIQAVSSNTLTGTSGTQLILNKTQ